MCDLIGGNPEAFARQLMQRDPRFGPFVRQFWGKSPQQMAMENGVDWGTVDKAMSLFKSRRKD